MRGHLEFDGGLSFEGDGGAQAGESGDGVEEASATGGARRVNFALHHLQNEMEFARIDFFQEREIEGVQFFAVIFREMADRHTPGFVNRGAAPGEGDVLQVSGAFECQVVGDKNFAAPDGPVGTVAGAVEGDADNLAIEMIFSHAGGDVRVVVLHRDVLQVFPLKSPFGRKIIGMEIVGDDRRLHFENALKMDYRFIEEIVALEIFQIADVLAEECFPAADDADGIF